MKKKILVSLLAFVMLACMLTLGALAAGEAGSDFKIAAGSVSLKDGVRPNFKVVIPKGIDPTDVKLLVWEGETTDTNFDVNTKMKDDNGNKIPAVVVDRNFKDDEKEDRYVFQYTGISAKEMGKTIYARAYYEAEGKIVYTAPVRYSVVQYLHNTAKNANSSEALKALVASIRAYGAAAQSYFAADGEDVGTSIANELYTINVVNGTLADGFTKGTYLAGETITLVASEKDGFEFSHWEDANGNKVSAENLTAIANATYTTYGYQKAVKAAFEVFELLTGGNQ